MTWFDILKLGGEDLFDGERKKNVGNQDPKHDYDDEENSGRIEDFFYNVKDTATTRPHFERQAKKKFSNIEGDLQIIYDNIKKKVGLNLTADNERLFGFTSDIDRKHLITWKVIDGGRKYPSSNTNLTPSRLGNKKVVVFDSVYLSDRWHMGNLNPNNFRELFDGDKEAWKQLEKKGTTGRYGSADIYTMNQRTPRTPEFNAWNKKMNKLKNSLKTANKFSAENIKADINQLTRYGKQKGFISEKTKADQTTNVNRNNNKNNNRPKSRKELAYLRRNKKRQD